LLGAIAHVDPAWLSVQVESSRRVRTDDRFARVTDDPMPNLDQLMTLIETGVAPRRNARRS